MWDFPFFPEQASTFAGQVDAIFFVLMALSFVFGLPVAGLIVFFAIRYREGTDVNRTKLITEDLRLELSWSLIPFVLSLGVFGWAAVVYFDVMQPPPGTHDIYVIGKQWMWHSQHPTGKSEINALHIPVDQPVKLIMTSQDVIHDFYIPAFRVKQDVLPGRYVTMWFEATEPGEYHLFCAEFCGTEHSKMIGTVTVMEQIEYERWLAGDSGEPLAVVGERLFQERGCASCHGVEAEGDRGPSLVGLFGSEVSLQDGRSVTADEAYLRESIVNPQAKVVAGFQPIMPTYEGQISEEGLIQLVAYIKTLQNSEQ